MKYDRGYFPKVCLAVELQVSVWLLGGGKIGARDHCPYELQVQNEIFDSVRRPFIVKEQKIFDSFVKGHFLHYLSHPLERKGNKGYFVHNLVRTSTMPYGFVITGFSYGRAAQQRGARLS